jgi:hypothetical protein
MATRIEPCPFCGSVHLHITQNGLSYCVVCQSCKAKGSHRSELRQAISLWNQARRSATGETMGKPYNNDTETPATSGTRAAGR